MRKYLYAAPLAATALVLTTAAAQAQTATTHTARPPSHVLTVKRLNGSAVKAGAVLKASLAKGTTVTIALAGHKMTCKKASFAMTIVTNPVAKGKATGTVTSEKISRCKINVSGITVTSIVAGNLPYNATISDAKGDPVKVSETSGEAPIEFTATVMFEGNPIVCTYQAAGSTGHASDTHHTVTFTKQAFNLAPESNGFCLAGPSKLSVTFGPIVDSSLHTSPTVYINPART